MRLLALWAAPGAGGDVGVRHRALCLLSLLMLTVIPICTASKLIMADDVDLEEITTCGLVIVSTVAILIKAICFVHQRSTLQQMVRLMAVAQRTHCNAEASARVRHGYQQFATRLFLCLQVVAGVFPVVVWDLAPLLSCAFYSANSSLPCGKTPFPVWLPPVLQVSPGYEVMYITQVSSHLVTTSTTTGVNLFFINLMLMIAAELDVLNENISDVRKATSTSTGGEVEEGAVASYVFTADRRTSTQDVLRRRDISDGVQSSGTVQHHPSGDIIIDPDEEMYQQLVVNIRHHQYMIESVTLLQTAMDYPVFILLFMNMSTICANILIIFVNGMNPASALKSVVASLFFISETAIYCCFGHIIVQQSELLTNSAFSCNWPDGSTRFKRSVLIFMLRASQPMEITVGKTYSLSRQTLLQVLNGAYTLFNMLYRLNSTK
nr:odorant receptor SameORX [Schistocerca americana]